MLRAFFISQKLAISNLSSNKGRTALTLLGIVIGITSVILISGSGNGFRRFVMAQVDSFGPDSIQVETKVPNNGKSNARPSMTGIQITTLTVEDAESMKKIPNVAEVYPASISQSLVSFEGVNKNILLMGAGSSAPNVDLGIKVKEGRFFSESENNDLAQVAVIGHDVVDSFFGNSPALGKDIRIKGQNYKVIGVLDKRGTVAAFNFDALIYVPIKTLQKKISGVNHIFYFTVKAKDSRLIDNTVEDIKEALRERHNISDPSKDDFYVQSVKEARETISTVLSSVNILLLALTSISLIVGGVGIMNVMYVAVVERTFEIGLRKAVGAKPRDIMRQFLFEAIYITFLGGIAGIILGFVFSFFISYLFKRSGFDLTLTVTFDSLLLATGFSIATGIIFGFYPAYKASRLSPMEAIGKS